MLRIEQHPSPNFGPRRNDLTPHLIVIHYTAMQSAEAAIARLCDPIAEVSAHYVVCRTGQITQLVAEDMRAWHAGAGSWAGQDDINSRSIGIELDNAGGHPFSEPQMIALERLLSQIMMRWAIKPKGVIGHSDLAAGRKIDPGKHFDWQRLARQNLARTVGCSDKPLRCDEQAFRRLAVLCGYCEGLGTDVLLQAVRLRYRPFATGPLTADDLAVLMT